MFVDLRNSESMKTVVEEAQSHFTLKKEIKAEKDQNVVFFALFFVLFFLSRRATAAAA